MIIGIDLGTTYSLCSYFNGTEAVLIPNSKGSFLTPSVVHFQEDMSVVVGEWTGKGEPLKSFRYFKEYMGTEQNFQLGEESFTPMDLSALVLKQLKEDAEAYLKEKVTEAVISVPAYFNHNQRVATKQAGELAGLCTSRLINEPSAAALAYQFGYEEATLLVFDFGGGTFDVSMVDCFDNIIEILSISGDNHLGGKTVDKKLAQYFCGMNQIEFQDLSEEEQKKLLDDMEVLKEKLAENSQILYRFREKEMVIQDFVLKSICKPLFEQIAKIMAQAVWDSQKQVQDIDAVIFVGGSSRLLGLGDFVTELLEKKPISHLHPQTVVAMGMGYYAGMKERQTQVKEMILTDVCPFTLGVATAHGKNDENLHVTALIPRNTTLPASHSSYFVPCGENQESIAVTIVQGENYFAKDNLMLKVIDFPIPKSEEEKPQIEICFTYDFNGILQVNITHTSSGNCQQVDIMSNFVQEMSPEEQQIAKSRLEAFRLVQEVQSDLLLQRANGQFSRLGQQEKGLLKFHMDQYCLVKGKSLTETRKLSQRLAYLVDMLEHWQNHFYQKDQYLKKQMSFPEFFQEEKDDEIDMSDFFPGMPPK